VRTLLYSDRPPGCTSSAKPPTYRKLEFKAIFDTHGQVPTRGLVATQRWVLGAVFVYQLVLLYRYQLGADLRVGLKPFLKAA
jgi:hypothetical protein